MISVRGLGESETKAVCLRLEFATGTAGACDCSGCDDETVVVGVWTDRDKSLLAKLGGGGGAGRCVSDSSWSYVERPRRR